MSNQKHPIKPNAETVAAMEEARAGKTEVFEAIEKFMADLNDDTSGDQLIDATLPDDDSDNS